MELPLECMGNEQFARLRAETENCGFLAPPPENDLPAKKPRAQRHARVPGQPVRRAPCMREQEAHLFRKMNYLKYQAGRLRDTLDVGRPKSLLTARSRSCTMNPWRPRIRSSCANLRLVVSIAKRDVGPAVDFFELVSDGNMSLLRAVEKFDVSQGNRFSTYDNVGDHQELRPQYPCRAPLS